MDKWIVEIERIRAGQERDYVDSVYEVIYTFSRLNDVWTPDQEQVIAFAKADYGDFRVNPPEGPVGNNPLDYLKTFQQLAENKWRVVIVHPFMD